jgi:tetratricopeptide (TPR) repeat protein
MKTFIVPGQMVLVLIILLGVYNLHAGIITDSKPLLASRSVSVPDPADSPATSRPLKDFLAPQINVESIKTEAINIAIRTVKELPGADSFALLGDVHRNNGNSTDALKCWRKSLELNPKNAAALNGMAWVAMMKAEYDKAVELWREAIRINPELPDVHLALAGALVCLGKSEEAITSLKRDIEMSSQPGLSYAMLGNQHLLLGEYDEAKAAFTAALPYPSSRCKAYYGLATVHTRLGEMDKSRQYTDTFRKLKAEEMEALKKRDRAFDDLASVCEHVAQTHTDIATVYLKHNRLEEAEQLLQRATLLNVNNVHSRQILGSVYQQTGRHAKAFEMHEQLSRIEPKKTLHYFNMGICSAMLRQFDKAEKSFRKMIEITPTQAKGYRETARFYLMIGRKKGEALLLAQKAADLEKNADTFYVLSWACEANGDIKGSLGAISRAIELAPDNTDYKRTYERLKKQEEQNDQ